MSYTILKADKYARLYLRFIIHVKFIFSYSEKEDNLLKHGVIVGDMNANHQTPSEAPSCVHLYSQQGTNFESAGAKYQFHRLT